MPIDGKEETLRTKPEKRRGYRGETQFFGEDLSVGPTARTAAQPQTTQKGGGRETSLNRTVWGKPQDQVSIPLSRGKRGLRVSGSFLYTSDDKRSEDFRSQKFGKSQVNSRDFLGGITRSVQVPKGPRGSVEPKKDGSIGLILSVCIPKMKFYDDKIVSGENEDRWKIFDRLSGGKHTHTNMYSGI